MPGKLPLKLSWKMDGGVFPSEYIKELRSQLGLKLVISKKGAL